MQPQLTLVINDVTYQHIVTIHFSTDINHEPVVTASDLFGKAYTFPLNNRIIKIEEENNNG